MYIESSSGNANDKAHFESPPVTATSPKCLRFWYHMYGADIGTLNVYVRQTSLRSPSWTKSGTQGNRWRSAEVDISISAKYSVIKLLPHSEILKRLYLIIIYYISY